MLKRNIFNPDSTKDDSNISADIFVYVDEEYLETVRISLLSCIQIRGSGSITVICSKDRLDVKSLCEELGCKYSLVNAIKENASRYIIITHGHCVIYPDALKVVRHHFKGSNNVVELNHNMYSSNNLVDTSIQSDASLASLISIATGSFSVPVYTGGPIVVKNLQERTLENVSDHVLFVSNIAEMISSGKGTTITSHPCCESLSSGEIDHNISSRITRFRVEKLLSRHSQYVDTASLILRHAVSWFYMRYHRVKVVINILFALAVAFWVGFSVPKELVSPKVLLIAASSFIFHYIATVMSGDRRRPTERLRDIILDIEAYLYVSLRRSEGINAIYYRIQFLSIYLAILLISLGIFITNFIYLNQHHGGFVFDDVIRLSVGIIFLLYLYLTIHKYLSARFRSFTRRKVSISGSSSYESMWVIDLTHKGAAYTSEARLEIGDETPLVFRIPTLDSDVLITVVGKVTYCARQDSSYQIGVAFKELSQDTQDNLMLYSSVIYPYRQARKIEDEFSVEPSESTSRLAFATMQKPTNYLSYCIYSFAAVLIFGFIITSTPIDHRSVNNQTIKRMSSDLSTIQTLSTYKSGLGADGSLNNYLSNNEVSLRASIYIDQNNNGMRDPGEDGLSNVGIKLFRSDNTQVDFVSADNSDANEDIQEYFTDESGNLCMRYVKYGNYFVRFKNVPDGLQLSDPIRKNDNIFQDKHGYRTSIFRVDENHNGDIEQLNIGLVQSYDLGIHHEIINEPSRGFLSGDIVIYRVTVTNSGPANVSPGYIVSADLGADLKDINALMRSTTGFTPCGFDDGHMSCVATSALLAGESKTIEFDITSHVSPSSSSARRTVTTNVQASKADPNELDTKKTNNSYSSIVFAGNPSAIGSRVFLDNNQNGVMDPGEYGIPGIRVGLLRFDDNNGDGIKDPGELTEIAVDTTDSNGYFGANKGNSSFQNLLANKEYALVFSSIPKGFNPGQFVERITGDNGSKEVSYRSEFFTLGADSIYQFNNFAISPKESQISTRLYIDKNGNGKFDTNDRALNGYDVRVKRWIDFNNNNKIDDGEVSDIGFITSGEQGEVDFRGFDSVFPTRYTLELETDGRYSFADGGKLSSTRIQTSYKTSKMFPRSVIVKENGLNISGSIYIDVNSNSIKDENEYGARGVALVLTDEKSSKSYSAKTNKLGEYTFSDVVTGSYTLHVKTNSLPRGYGVRQFSTPSSGSQIADSYIKWNVSEKDSSIQTDFSLIPFSNISGSAKTANNNEYSYLSDTGVTLLSMKNIISRVHSSENGLYRFANVLPGSYKVDVEQGVSSYVLAVPGDVRIANQSKQNNIFSGQIIIDGNGSVKISPQISSLAGKSVILITIFCVIISIAILIRRKKLFF